MVGRRKNETRWFLTAIYLHLAPLMKVRVLPPCLLSNFIYIMNNKIYFYKRRHKGDTADVTYAAIINSDSTISVGHAKCSKKDNFHKNVGRTIASGRAEKKGIILPIQESPSKTLVSWARNHNHEINN